MFTARSGIMNYLYSLHRTEACNLPGNRTFVKQVTEVFVLIVVKEGRGEASIDGKHTLLHKDMVLLCNPGRVLELHFAPDQSLMMQFVYFHRLRREEAEGGGLLYRACQDPWLPDGQLHVSSPYQFGQLVKQLLALEAVHVDGREQEEAALSEGVLLYELLRMVKPGGQQTSEAIASNQRIQVALDYIQEHYQEEITRDGLAAMTGFNPRFFSMLFRKETGFGFAAYLAHVRISKAKEQLLLSTHNLNEVAHNVGYSNGLYLSRKFKQIVGVAPSAYVRQPKRIVVYDWIGNVLALNIKPVGASYFFGLHNLTLMKEELQGVIDVGRSSISPVLQLEPDLIVAPSWLETGFIQQMQKVAPTLIVPYGDPFERFRHLASLLDRREEAEVFAAAYRQHAATVREQIGEAIRPGETVGIYEIQQDNLWIMNEYHGRGGYNLYRSLGLNPPAKVKADIFGRGMARKVPLAMLPEYAADHMIFCSFDEDGIREQERLKSLGLWQTIPACVNNRAFWVNRLVFHPYDVLALDKQLDIQGQLLASRISK
ncbi:helix-turn-helix domain-containing protein [Paenibacillaceae bacterium]|nr:helix-turn-helix domain-containing protein [Paenibacillaceae bacterium]